MFGRASSDSAARAAGASTAAGVGVAAAKGKGETSVVGLVVGVIVLAIILGMVVLRPNGVALSGAVTGDREITLTWTSAAAPLSSTKVQVAVALASDPHMSLGLIVPPEDKSHVTAAVDTMPDGSTFLNSTDYVFTVQWTTDNGIVLRQQSVTVKAPPAPTVTTALTSTSVTLTWSGAPSNTDGAWVIITEISPTHNVGNTMSISSSPSGTRTFNGLTPGASYTLQNFFLQGMQPLAQGIVILAFTLPSS